MAVENITLNLIPTGDTPSIHVAQFDIDRPFTVTLKEGEDDFTPTGYTIELQVRKVDNTIVTTTPSQSSGNVVTFNTTEQMTACSGTNLAELQLTKDSQTFATLHFYLVVQRDVLAGGVTSESDIYNLTEQIAEIVPEVIGDDYYNKEEVDEKIAEIPTFDPTNYYDKADVNALLNDKADVSDLPDMTNYYNKPQTDALLNDKADVSDLPDMTDYYTKSEVDTKITDLYQIKTASGSIVHITDGGNAIPVKSLVSEIVAVETGNGQPKSPTNPYTISGFDNGVVKVTSENVFDMDSWLTSINREHTVIGNVITISYLKLPVYDNPCVISNTDKPFFLSVNEIGGNATGVKLQLIDSSNNVVAQVTNASRTASGIGCKIRIDYGKGGSAIFNNPIVSEYYNTYTFAFGQTVYGGHFDNKGNLVVTHGYIASYNGETINEPWLSSMDNYVPNTSPSTGSQVVYPLTTPITLSITSQDIPTLLGENNIFSDTGDVEVKYFTSKSDGIAELIKAFM